ncbi:MAG: polysaccharide biosynthesis C-terminal domain-containing protein, partial [Candidatus Omnitrophica bacterium]|nr:polysaccharide biosynthesis C-terminal domain-containing protein [Candidatus Omnitrophota bacterium]
MVLLGGVIIRLAFQRGSFDAYSTQITSQALIFFALGLPFYGISRIFVSAFYALQDTKTPVKVAALCLVINVVLNFILMYPLKIGGIALASSISGLVN